MNSEIIVIGDEILLGQTIDTNSGFIAQQMAKLGQPVHVTTVIGDDKDAMLEEFRRAYHRSDVVLITGGLGPTHDDKTKETLARFFNLPIIFRNDILESIRERFRARQLTLNESTREQAQFPEGATAIANSFGSAPGIWIEREGRIFVAMPGVPNETRAMMTESVIPKLRKKFAERDTTRFLSLHTFGVIESELYEKLDNLDEIEQNANLAFLPSYRGVKLRLTVRAKSSEAADELLRRAERLVRDKIGSYIIGTGEEFTVEELIGQLLRDRGWKLVTAESCTGGLLSKRLTDVPGSSDWFERGWVTYSNDAKMEELGVPLSLLEAHGAVSPEVAEAMAEGALTRGRGNVALSLTGIAGPGGGTEDKPVGLVYIGYADATTVTHKKHIFPDNRALNRDRSATAALMLLMRQFESIEGQRSDQLV